MRLELLIPTPPTPSPSPPVWAFNYRAQAGCEAPDNLMLRAVVTWWEPMEECVEENVGVRYHDTLLLSHLDICFLNVRPGEVPWLGPPNSQLRSSTTTCMPHHHHRQCNGFVKLWKPRFIWDFAPDFLCDINVWKIGQFPGHHFAFQTVFPALHAWVFIPDLTVIRSLLYWFYSQVVVSVAGIPLVIVVVGILCLVVLDGLGPLAKLPVGEVLQLTRHIFTVSRGRWRSEEWPGWQASTFCNIQTTHTNINIWRCLHCKNSFILFLQSSVALYKWHTLPRPGDNKYQRRSIRSLVIYRYYRC